MFAARKLQEAVAAKTDEDKLRRLVALGGAVKLAGSALGPEYALIIFGHLMTARVRGCSNDLPFL